MDVFQIGTDPTKSFRSIKNYPGARIDDKNQPSAMLWCDEALGLNWIWSSPIQADYTDFFFLTTEDALMFILQFGAKYIAPRTNI
jgi:hypothetical protein